jgi:hypothetical protein
MPSPVEILVRVLGTQAAAEQIRQVAAAQAQLAGSAAATAPATGAAATALQHEADAARAATTQLERAAVAERDLVAAETRGAAAHTATTAAIVKESAALATLKNSAMAASLALAMPVSGRGGRGGGGGAGTRASLIYTLSDLISTQGAGFDLTRFAMQQGPQIAQSMLIGSSMSLGTMAVAGAGFAVAAAPLIYALNQLRETIKVQSDALALTRGNNSFTGTALGSMIELRRRSGELSEDDARRLMADAQANKNAAAVEPPAPWKAGFKGLLNPMSLLPGGAGASFTVGYLGQVQANEKAAREIEIRNMEILRKLQATTEETYASKAQVAMATKDKEAQYTLAFNEKIAAQEKIEHAEKLIRAARNSDEQIEIIKEFGKRREFLLKENLAAELSVIEIREQALRAEQVREMANKERVAQLQAQLIQVQAQGGAITAANDAARAAAAQETQDAIARVRERDSLSFQVESQFVTLQSQLGTWAENLANTLLSPVRGFRDGLASSLDELIEKGGTAGEFFQGIAAGIGASMRRAFADMLADYVTKHVLMKGVALAWEGFLKVLRWAGVVDENAAEAAKMPAKAVNATLSSIGSFGVAVAIGLAAIAAVLAATGAFAEGGMVRGPGGPKSDSILARVSNGEGILNAAAMNRIGEDNLNRLNAGGSLASVAAPAGGSSGSPVSLNLAVLDDGSRVQKWLRTTDGRGFMLDLAREALHEVTGKG